VNAEKHCVVTLEGEEVCLAAWKHIMEVPETTFYRYAGYATEGRLAQKHGNSGLFKPRAHTM
jgi:ribosomal protein L35AE/L33A